jgi:hypothetical protein
METDEKRSLRAGAERKSDWAARIGDDLTAMPGPIQEKHRAMMQALAEVLDETLNGKGGASAQSSGERVGFFLAVYDMEHEGPAPGRFNYISNSNKTDVRAMLREIEARLSARLQAEREA